MFPTDFNVDNLSATTIDSTADSSEHVKVGRSFKFDFDTKSFVFEDGKNIEPNMVDSIEQWIHLFILTGVNKYAIYNEDFGVDLDIIGRRLPASYVVSEIERTITEGILKGLPAVVSVDNWSFDKGVFSFNVKTNTGEEIHITDENY